MEILKPGSIKSIQDKGYFVCPTCGCIWVANKDEYELAEPGYDQDLVPAMKCPVKGCRNTYQIYGVFVSDEEIDEMRAREINKGRYA